MPDANQGTEAWLLERVGFCTASRFDAVLAKIKTGEAATRRNYKLQIVTERLTGLPTPSFNQSAAMIWGTEHEPYARMALEAQNGVMVIEAPFRKHSMMDWVGCSPDGEIDLDGLCELKCPDSTTHVEWLQSGLVPTEHVPQIQGQMWITGRQWCDFVSFDPRMPERLRLFVVRVPRDDAYIVALRLEVEKFLGEVQELHDRLMKL